MVVIFFRIFLVIATSAIALPSFEAKADQHDGSSASPPFMYNWSGSYIGLNAGKKFTHLGGAVTRRDTGFSDPTSMSPNAGIGGGHIGYLEQIGHLVVGFELAVATGTAEATKDSSFYSDRTRTMSLGNMTQGVVRLGYAEDRWLAYAKAGVVLSEVMLRSNAASSGALMTRSSFVEDGFTIGGGLDYALTNNVILGVDYSYLMIEAGNRAGVNAVGVAWSRHTGIRADASVVSARLSYKFD